MSSELYLDTLEGRIRIAREVLRTRDPSMFMRQADELGDFNIGLLYAYVRSFVRLAYLGDVQLTATDLATTRQTIKRQIIELENMLEVSLFERIGSSSRLTPMGAMWLPRAQEFFDLASSFISHRSVNSAGYQSTQLPLRMLLNDMDNSRLLRGFARAWMKGDQRLSSDWFKPFASNCILYDRQRGRWYSRAIGSDTPFQQWFGAEAARASEGKQIHEMETGQDIGDDILLLLDTVFTRGGLHFSEVACQLTDPTTSDRKPAFWQRLLAEVIDRDGSPLVASVIEITDPLRTDQEPDERA